MLIGIFSDAHGHLGGFQKAIEALEEAGVDRCYFLGDAIGYIPSVDVLRHLRRSDIVCVKGNHEVMLMEGCFERNNDDIYRFRIIAKLLSDEDVHQISEWPIEILTTVGDHALLFVHGSPSDPTFGYVYPDSDLKYFSETPADVIFMGNTHRPFVRQYGPKLFVNVGSCGLPRDGDGRGCVCVYDSSSNIASLMRFDISGSCEPLLQDPEIHHSVKRHLRRSLEARKEG